MTPMDDSVEGRQDGFLEEGAFELSLATRRVLWQMETEKEVARGPSVPGLEARMCPACC